MDHSQPPLFMEDIADVNTMKSAQTGFLIMKACYLYAFCHKKGFQNYQ